MIVYAYFGLAQYECPEFRRRIQAHTIHFENNVPFVRMRIETIEQMIDVLDDFSDCYKIIIYQ